MSTPTVRSAPKPTPESPLYPYGDTLADSDGYLYDTNGAAVIIDGRHATIAALEAEADYWATHEFRRAVSTQTSE